MFQGDVSDVEEKKSKQFGEYRTRRLVLEKWDQMQG
jgi:hypothetical protein